MDFSQERYIKQRLFGKSFENMECPSLTKCYMRCITIGQTFSDTFSFVDLEKCYIPCSFFQEGDLWRLINKGVAPCLLSKMHHLMTAFIQSEIITRGMFTDDELHEVMGNRIFFHDHLIECWMCEIDIDVVSQTFSSKGPSMDYAMECKNFVKKNIFIIHDVVKYNGKDTKLIYLYDGDYVLSSFRKELQ